MASHPAVQHISRCSIQPKIVSEKSQHIHLNPWDLSLLSINYIQKGLLFSKPSPASSSISIIDHLKSSLSQTLLHFPPLAGHLVTHNEEDPPSYSISLDCNKNPGIDFVHAVADLSVAEILYSIDVHPIVHSFFLLHKAINHDGHTLPLLAVQVTELLDGIFIACSFNHIIGDGVSFWQFLNTWATICRGMLQGKQDHIVHPPVLKLARWFPNGHGPIINLPFTHHDEFIDRYLPPTLLRVRFFHFPSESIASLKAKANYECKTNTITISSFQALSALVWKCVTRARRYLQSHHKTTCRLATDDRSRINPPLSPDYFGNCIEAVEATVTVEELLSHGIGWAAKLLHEAVNNHNDSKVRSWLDEWIKSPEIYRYRNFSAPCNVFMGSSPRFNMYGCDFGWGKPEAVRSGSSNKFDGKVASYPGRQGGGSVDLEISLPPESMSALESDPEFMDAVSALPPHQLY